MLKPFFQFTVFLVLLFTYSALISQDTIVTADIRILFKVGKIQKIENEIIYFTDKSSGEKLEFSTEKVSYVSFNTTGDTLVYPVVRYNFIDCNIKRIGRSSVEYSLPGSYLVHDIGKNKVFACMFEDSPQSEKAWYFKSIFDNFKFYFKIKRKEKLIRINGQERLVEVDSLINGVIYFNTYEKKYAIKSSISKSKVKKLFFADFNPSPYKNNFTDYVLTKSDNYLSGRIDAVYSESINFKIIKIIVDRPQKISLSKQEIVAIYFCEFEEANDP